MSMNPNWTRWIQASLTSYFKDFIETQGKLNLLIEGQERPKTNQDWAELRWDGPYAREESRNLWHLDVEINIAVSSVLNREDTHTHKRHVGLVQSSYINYIPIHKYGDGDDDDQSYLGCFQLKVEAREAIITSYFGKVAPDLELEQSTVEAHYRMTLSANT